MALPILDIGTFIKDPTSTSARAFTQQLREACHEPGFCYLSGHGVNPHVEKKLRAVSRSFFRLPEEERRSLAIANTPHFRGHTILGDERTKGARDWREQIDFGVEEEAPAVGPDDPPWLNLRGPNQWPDDASLPDLKPTVLTWMDQMERLGLAVTRALALGLGQPIDRFDYALLPHVDAHVKIARYPAQDAAATAAASGQGVGLHTDSGLLSLILQDENVGGLRVQVGDKLIDATPIPGTYIMNLGEMFQSATDGFLKATPHRVDSPPPGKERISVAYFYNPRYESRFDPVDLPEELAVRARGGGGQHKDRSDIVYPTFGYNNLKIRLRSHPDVASAHYPGVEL